MSEAVTFLLTDVEGSTRLWETLPDAMRRINVRHDALVDEVVGGTGTVFRDRAEGDSSFAAFDDAATAVAAAVALQRAIDAEPWPDGLTVRVRAALHTGPAEQRDGQYYGPVVNRGVRLRALAHGAQIVLSESVVTAIEQLPDGIELRDLGTHRLKDLAAPEHVYQVCGDGLLDQFPPLRSLDVIRNNLTEATTAFVGRTDEQKAIVDLLRTQRLVTITGSGGVGKTRIAREVAAKLVDRFSDGVWFVDFTAARNEGDVGRAVADAVGAKDDPVRSPAEVVADQLRSTTTLLVLDNCEHVASAASALVTAVLGAAPDVCVLITSRQPIGTPGERVWRVPPLDRDTALELFVDRVRVAEPLRGFDDAERAAVERLCEQLDGIPLAIEMTAARVKEMPSIAALADALTDRLSVAAAESGAPDRQRTMRATIEWSHDLLTPEQRRLLRRLSVFLGGFTLDAAEGVCADERLDAFAVFDVLGELVAQSLVQADDDGAEFRYRLLEVVREFAAERLNEGGDARFIPQRHQAWFLALAEGVSPDYNSTGASALDVLERELPNFRRAIDWAGESLDEDARYRLVLALHRLTVRRGYWREAAEWIESVLATPPVRRGWRASALVNLANVQEHLGRKEAAAASYSSAAALFAEIDSDIHIWGADLDEDARQRHHETFLGQQAWCLSRQANLELSGQEALALTSESVRLARGPGGHALAVGLTSAGGIAYTRGALNEAELYLNEALELWAELGDQVALAAAQLTLGAVEWAHGRFAAARMLYESSLELSEAAGDSAGVAWAVRNLADLAALTGAPNAATMAADALLRLEALHDRASSVHAQMLILRTGGGLTGEDVVASARSVGDPALVVEALTVALACDPDSPAAPQFLAEAEPLLNSLSTTKKVQLLAAMASATKSPQRLRSAAALVAVDPDPESLIQVCACAASVLHDDASVAVVDLRTEVVETLSAAHTGDMVPFLRECAARLEAAIESI
ncbi:MAG TPA: NB-ARC domain-containing protein [Acidimicrobiales bacterium]|nr:NB-ARC domain-containing protein [Acidimicrobiales bacterium]